MEAQSFSAQSPDYLSLRGDPAAYLPVGQPQFISVIFFFPRNLGGNLITQIQNGTFQAWHGMQFLQKLILSRNPLSVIADTSFFELPSVKYLDLGATQVTQQTLLMLLLTTVRLETLKLPSDMACCLCQEKHTTETPCRTIKFHCENLCTTSAPHCAHTDPLAETQGEIMEAVQSRKLNASTVLNLKPKKPSLGDHETVTLAVVLSLTGTDGDLRNPNDHISRTNSYSPRHLSRQEGKTSKELMLMLHSIQHMGWTSEADIRKLYFLAKVLVAELKNKLHKAKSIVTVKNTVSPLPTPAMQKDEVHEIPAAEGETTTGWMQKQRDLGLNRAALNLWEAASRLKPTDNISVFRHHKISTPPSKHSLSRSPAEAPHSSGSFKIQNYSDAVEQTKKTHGMEDVEDVEDAEEAPSPRQDYVWAYKKHKQGDSPYLNKSNQLFYKTFGNVNPEEEPTPTESKAEQRLNTNQHFFCNLLVNSPPAASSMLEDMAEEEGSSLGGHLPAVPQTAETHGKQQKEGSAFLNKPGSSDSPDGASVQGDLFETKVNRRLRLLVPDKALRMFIAHVARALRTDCRLPEVQLACAKMVSKTGLLIKLLSERQDDQRASALVGECLLEGNVSNGTAQAKEAGKKPAGKRKPQYTSGDRLLLAISVSVIIMINLTVICLVEVCSQKPAAASQPQSTSKSRPRWLFQKLLPRGWSKNKYNVREQGSRVSDLGKTKPQWLRDLYQPLDSQHKKSMAELYDEETSDEEEIFNKSELNWMPAAPQKSCDSGETQLSRDLMPLPCSSGAPQEPEQRSCSVEEDATGGHTLGIPQSSSQREGNRKATRDGEPS
ncbi:leucine-rich repeat-containing protein 37A2-like [Gymnogyps californianus]|uniref:leucine-rich repeat-containing protein 37A2-like n=1 Tax=Gymnogyps californianus TaxID=33616 RepID=UPI0021CA2432|nr:leucine-rich repeat-containing protein 37A2-like [Gymnogyps californianus]